MKKLIRGEHYNQETAMHAGYHLEITATETAYLVSGEDCFGRRDDSSYRRKVARHPSMRDKYYEFY